MPLLLQPPPARRAQIDELQDEMATASAAAERALARERQRADRLNKQVETLSAEVVQTKKQVEVVVGQAERAEVDKAVERGRADALRTTIDELRAGQALTADMHARDLAVTQHDGSASRPPQGATPAAQQAVAASEGCSRRC